jgi:heme/copper-type cytochrome/quinol oxidase subunit 4
MTDKKVLKFQKPKPKPAPKKAATPRQRTVVFWLAVILGIAAVWGYYQFLATQAV